MTCRKEILAAIGRLDRVGPSRWHARGEVVAEVRRLNRRYSPGTMRRILVYDLVGRSTLNHVATDKLDRKGRALSAPVSLTTPTRCPNYRRVTFQKGSRGSFALLRSFTRPSSR